MEENIISTVIPLATAIIGGMFGSYLTYYFAIKSKKAENILKFKEEKYSNLLILLQGFLGSNASNETKKEFFNEQYKSWLYCSDDVARSINILINLIKDSKGSAPDKVKGNKAIGDIVLTMRKDLLGKTKLKYDDFQYTNVIE